MEIRIATGLIDSHPQSDSIGVFTFEETPLRKWSISFDLSVRYPAVRTLLLSQRDIAINWWSM